MKYNLIWCEYCNLIGWSAWSKIGYTSRLVLWGHQCIHSPNQVILGGGLIKGDNCNFVVRYTFTYVTSTCHLFKKLSRSIFLYMKRDNFLFYFYFIDKTSSSCAPTKGHHSYEITPITTPTKTTPLIRLWDDYNYDDDNVSFVLVRFSVLATVTKTTVRG
jgi:hypothetical protein